MPQELVSHIKKTLSLAWPMVLAQGLSLAALIIDTIMVGQAGMAELSHLSAGRSLIFVATTMGIGLINGIVVFTARLDGAGKPHACGRIWHAGLIYAALLGGVALAAVGLIGPLMLHLFGLPPDLAAGGSRYLAVMAFSVPGTYLLVACSLFLQGISRPKPAMAVMLVLAPLNVVLNWLFIYGKFGLPALGAAGAALATALCQWTGAIILGLYILKSRNFARYGVDAPLAGAWRDGAALRRFGLPLGIATGLELVGMTALVMFAGRMGEVVISGFEVAFNLQLIAFITVFGTGSATAVRIGNAIGARRFEQISLVGSAGAAVIVIIMMPFALLYSFMPEPFVAAFTHDDAVVAMTRSFLPFIVAAMVFDSTQFLFLHALRAAGDQLVASSLQVMAFLVVMVPAGWLFGVVLDLGGRGLMLAYVMGCVIASLSLGGRFAIIARRYAKAEK